MHQEGEEHCEEARSWTDLLLLFSLIAIGRRRRRTSFCCDFLPQPPSATTCPRDHKCNSLRSKWSLAKTCVITTVSVPSRRRPAKVASFFLLRGERSLGQLFVRALTRETGDAVYVSRSITNAGTCWTYRQKVNTTGASPCSRDLRARQWRGKPSDDDAALSTAGDGLHHFVVIEEKNRELVYVKTTGTGKGDLRHPEIS